jgi:hypothetical protein
MILYNNRPDGLEVTLDDESVVKLMVIRENPRFGIIARVKGQGRVVLWGKDDVDAHKDDTEEQFITQLKTLIGTV